MFPNSVQRITYFHLSLIVLGIGILIRINSDWMFGSLSLTDAGKFVGILANYGESSFRSTDYKTSRLPFIFFNYPIYAKIISNYPQIISVTISIISLSFLSYFILNKFISKAGAFFGSLLVAFSVAVHDPTTGGMYNNLFSSVLYCLSLCFIVDKKSNIRFLFAGIVYLFAISANLYYSIMLIPFGLIFILKVNEGLSNLLSQWRSRIGYGFIFVSGLFLGFVVLGSINALVFDRTFWFPAPQIEFIRAHMGSTNQALWGYHPYRSFIPGQDATVRVYFVALSVLLAATFFFRKLLSKRFFGSVLVCNSALATLFFLTLNLSGVMTMFPTHIGYPLILPAYLALAVIVDKLFSGFGRINQIFISIFLFLLVLAPLIFAHRIGKDYLLLSGVVLAATCLFAKGGYRSAVVAAAVAVGCVISSPPIYWSNYSPRGECHGDRDAYIAANQISRLAREIEPNPDKVKVWFDPAEIFQCGGRRLSNPIHVTDENFSEKLRWTTHPAIPVVSMYDSFAPVWDMKSIASLNEGDFQWIRRQYPDVTLILITRAADDDKKMLERIEQFGLKARWLLSRRVDRKSFSYQAIFLQFSK